MKKQLFFLALLLFGTLLPKGTAQLTTPNPSPDTFRIRNFPLGIWYAQEKIKKPKQAQSILLAKGDAQINRDWQTSKTLRNVGLGIQILGLGVEAIGLAKTLNGENGDESNLVLKGAGIMLGGAIVQLIATGPMKRAIRRFNGLQNGRIQPKVAPPIPTIYKAKPPAMETDTVTSLQPTPSPKKKSSKGLVAGKTWGGYAFPKSKSNVSFDGLKVGSTAYLGASEEKPNPSDTTGNYAHYGQKIGIGISIFDGLGVPVRYYLSPKKVLDGGIYLAGIAVIEDDEIQLKFAPMLGAGFTFFGNRFEKVSKQKIRAHGLALRLNRLTGDYATTMIAAGWAMETFKKDRANRSFIFELGLRGLFPNYELEGEPAKRAPGLYLRCHWNFFVG